MEEMQVMNGITVAIFYGCPVTLELRNVLGKSHAWKISLLEAEKGKHHPTIIRHQEKDYLGCYLTAQEITLSVIEKEHKRILLKISELCPDLDLDTLTFNIFPILLIK